MVDNRSIPRMRTLKAAKIVLDDRQSVIDCAIQDMSQTGARLKLATAVKLPLQFELQLVSEGKIVPVQVEWQKGALVGVTFRKT